MRTPTPGPVIIALVAAFAGAVMFATTSVTVAEGDTLTSIAARHGVSTAQLVEWNEIDDPDRIYVGDVIVVVGPDRGSASAAPVQHVVTAGDTLTLIAARYGASVAAIADANALDDIDHIQVGQQLTIGQPPGSSDSVADTPSAPDDASASTHTVAPGETLFSIARRYERTVAALAAANAITDTDRIRAGDVLTIPGDTTVVDAPADDDAAGDGQEADPAPTPDQPTVEDPPAPSEEPESRTDAGESASGAAPDPSASVAELADAFELWSLSYGVDQALLEAIAWYASDWDPTRVGIDTRVGIAQLTEAQVTLVETRLLGRDLDPFDGPDGVRLAARYLRYVQDRTHSEHEALMAFRQGLDSFLDDGPTADAEVFALAVADIRDQRS